jgi:hypothetical protein
MSAAARRAALAAIGCDLVAREGGPGQRRAAALMRRLEGREDEALALRDLPKVPAWARLPIAAQERVAQRAALASIADTLAHSIDGAWLGEHAHAAGEEAVDWAIGLAGSAPELEPVGGSDLAGRGYALLRTTLPDPLRPLLAWAPAEEASVSVETASTCVALAMKGAA